MCVSIDFVFAHRSCYNQDFKYFSCRLSLWETGNKIGIPPISSSLDFTSEKMGEFTVFMQFAHRPTWNYLVGKAVFDS